MVEGHEPAALDRLPGSGSSRRRIVWPWRRSLLSSYAGSSRNIMSISSMPSRARASSMGRAMPWASSASQRWMVVSMARRRKTKAPVWRGGTNVQTVSSGCEIDQGGVELIAGLAGEGHNAVGPRFFGEAGLVPGGVAGQPGITIGGYLFEGFPAEASGPLAHPLQPEGIDAAHMAGQGGDVPAGASLDRPVEAQGGGLEDGRAVAAEMVEVVGLEGLWVGLGLVGLVHHASRAFPRWHFDP